MKLFIRKYWKKILMIVVFVGATLCMFISFAEKQYVVGVLSGLTVIIPVIIWFSDEKENEVRDTKLSTHDDCLHWK